MSHLAIAKPDASEYAPYFAKYIDRIEGADIIDALRRQIAATLATLRGVSEADSLERYAEGKWSLREVAGHIIDTERIMAYRALRIARADQTPLPGFDQDPYIQAASVDERAWPHLLEELEAVRRANVLMFEGFPEAAWTRQGTASGKEITVRALAYLIAGHELHHMQIVRERYL
jgi:DinB superfamily